MDQEERAALGVRLSTSTLMPLVVSLIKVDNPILSSTDWKSVNIALKTYVAEYWRKVRESTPSINRCQRGEGFLKNVGFKNGRESHRNFATCFKKKGLLKKDSVQQIGHDIASIEEQKTNGSY